MALSKKQVAQAFHGKTIKSVDLSASNVWEFNFTDGTTIGVWAEIGGVVGLPFVYAEAVDQPVNPE